MYQRIIELLRIHGYAKTDSAVGPFYVKAISGTKKAVFVSYDENPDGSRVTQEDLDEIAEEEKIILGEEVPLLILLLSEHGETWFLDPKHQFDELKEPVSMILQTGKAVRSKKEKERGILSTYKVTIAIAAVNLMMFIASEIFGDVIYYMGASRPDLVLFKHQIYRLLSSNYLHFGWEHFYGNMVSLVVLGAVLEKAIGSLRYFLLYTGSGILGSLVSAVYYESIGEIAWSAGASGAIFGIIGGLAASLIFRREELPGIDIKWMTFAVCASLFHGFQSYGIDNAAHIGGCAGGFILALLLHVLQKGRQG